MIIFLDEGNILPSSRISEYLHIFKLKEMMKNSVREAYDFFYQGKYWDALRIYRRLSQEIGYDFFEINIKKCEEKLKKSDFFELKKNNQFLFGREKLFDERKPSKSSFVLGRETVWFDICVENASEFLIGVELFENLKNYNDKLILYYSYYDEKPPLIENIKDYKYIQIGSENCLSPISLPVKENSKFIKIGLRKWGGGNDISLKNEFKYDILFDGISVIVPTYKGELFIGNCLNSLYEQNLSRDKWEVIFITNGEKDNSEKIISIFKRKNPDIEIKVIHSEEAGAGLARNIGLSLATFKYTTFLDDDDQISSGYLKDFLLAAQDDYIVLTQILDLKDGILYDNSINKQVKNALQKNKITANDVSSAITMNASKLIPTFWAKQTIFDYKLDSGEDVVYWTDVVTKFNPKFKIVPLKKDSKYIRLIRGDSVSRKEPSFAFNVSQRLDVIEHLDDFLSRNIDKDLKSFVLSKIKAQSRFIINYLQNNIDEYKKFANLSFKKNKILNFDIKNHIASEVADTLVISYCFPPYIDTAGIVMAKRINEFGYPVDVVSANMDNIRVVDEKLTKLVDGYLGGHKLINTDPSFSNWKAIKKFCELSYESISKDKKRYKNIYSRAMWPASHFAAALYKSKNIECKWIAEFSDPLLKGIDGKDRFAEIELNWIDDLKLELFFRKDGIELPSKNNLFFWAEFLPYIMADEIIFTNENQMKYMLGYLGNEKLKGIVRNKSKISHHPVLSSKFYDFATINYHLSQDVINIGYFGSFYETRGLDDVFSCLSKLDQKLRNKIIIHIFTEQAEKINLESKYNELINNISINKYVGYFDFLSLTKKFDVLLVVDALTKGLKEINPYLPSKFSDYLGANARIWAICENQSVMHKKALSNEKCYVSFLQDEDSCMKVMQNILRLI